MVLVSLALAAGSVAGCHPQRPAKAPSASTSSVIVAADGVLCDLGRTLVQSAAKVVCLVPPGEDPHGLRLTPQQRAQMAAAQRVYINGYGLTPALTNWPGAKPVAELAVPTSPLLNPGQQVRTGQQVRDPHVWHDLRQSQAMVTWLAHDLGEALPNQAASITRRAKAMNTLLGELDHWNRVQFATIPSAPAGTPAVIASDHRGFASLARAYGLQEIAVVDGESNSVSLRPESLLEALHRLRQWHVRQLFSETLPPSRALERLSQLSGIGIAPKAVVADGLAAEAPSLPATTIANTCAVSEGLGGRCDRPGAQAIATRWRAIR